MKIIKAHPVHLILGLVVWSFWFVVLYGGLSVACEVAPPPEEAGIWNWINGSLLLLTLAITAGLLVLAWGCLQAAPGIKSNERFMLRTGAGLYLLSAVSAFVVALPVLVFPPCV